MDWHKEARQIITAFKNWTTDTPKRVWGWAMAIIALIGAPAVVAFWLQQYSPPVYVWIAFILLIAGIIWISFIPYYRRSTEKACVELFLDDTCIRYSNILIDKLPTYVYDTIYTIGIKTVNDRKAENIELKLVKIEPNTPIFRTIILKPRGITKEEPSTFSISPNGIKYVEVIRWYNDYSEAIIESYTNYHTGERIDDILMPEGNYIFTIQATGENIPKYESKFGVRINKTSMEFEEHNEQ